MNDVVWMEDDDGVKSSIIKIDKVNNNNNKKKKNDEKIIIK